jgi:hypothetical protein
MSKTTFSGPVRSEDTFKTVSKAASTGTITEVITLGDGPVTLGDEDTTLTNATHSGRLIVVPAITANRTITLPSPVAGAHFKFIYGGAAEEAENVIFDTGADANYFIGSIVHDDSDGDDVSIYADGNSNSKLTLTDFGSMEINILAKDSTNWLIWGFSQGADAPAFADQ